MHFTFSRPSKSPVKRKDLPKIKCNPIAEYQAAIESDGNAQIVSLGAEDCSSSIKHWFSTSSLSLDRLLNKKGIPAGRITEIFGVGHIGKSTILDHIMAGCQRAGGVAILADTESARDIVYTSRIGVDSKKLQMIEFDRGKLTVENVLDKIKLTANFWISKYPETPVVIGFDALGGTPTQEELEKKLGASGDEDQEHTKPGGAAKVLRQACRQLVGAIAGTKIAVVICNHEYEQINMRGGFGKKRETYGGEAIRLAASCRIELFNLGWIKRGDGQIIGRQVGAKFVKNRLGKPWNQTSFALIPGIGVDNSWDLYEGLRDRGIIVAAGSWASINLDGVILKFQGWAGMQQKCIEDPTLFPRLLSVYQIVLDKLEEPVNAGVSVQVPEVPVGV
jgi:recombination protein RecA